LKSGIVFTVSIKRTEMIAFKCFTWAEEGFAAI